MVIELLLADAPTPPHRADSELSVWADELGVTGSRFPQREQPVADLSHPAIEV
jgi:formate dehydrogenase major subunit